MSSSQTLASCSALSTALTVFGILVRELLGERADLLRMVLPDVLRGDRREADAVGDGARVPRLADAEAVHLADLHVGDHLRRAERR